MQSRFVTCGDVDPSRPFRELCCIFSYINEHLTHDSAIIGRQTAKIDFAQNVAASTARRSFA
jgi:hypothetical protein